MTIRPVPPAEFFLELSAATLRQWILERDESWRALARELFFRWKEHPNLSPTTLMAAIEAEIREAGK